MVTGHNDVGRVVTIHQTPGGDPFTVVINSDARATIVVSPDGSAVTISLRLPGQRELMPCSLILPELVAAQVFGPDFATTLRSGANGTDRAASEGDGPVGDGPGAWFTGGGV
jgi:hypothetical protein